jgi:threonine/homoserine/homoserine lactone efflux protein
MDSPHLWAFYLAFLPRFIGLGNPPLARSLLLAGLTSGSGWRGWPRSPSRWAGSGRWWRGGSGAPGSRARAARCLIGLGVRLAAARR